MTDVIQRIDIWAQSLCRELRQKSCLVPYSVMIEVIQAVGADLPPPPGEAVPPAVKVKPLECSKCQLPATKLLQMTTHECDPIPICEDCADENDVISSAINEHEMREFGGVYGQVTYHYLPIHQTPYPVAAPHPATEQPDAVQEATLAECLSSFLSHTDGWDEVQLRKRWGDDYVQNVLRSRAALRALEGGE